MNVFLLFLHPGITLNRGRFFFLRGQSHETAFKSLSRQKALVYVGRRHLMFFFHSELLFFSKEVRNKSQLDKKELFRVKTIM